MATLVVTVHGTTRMAASTTAQWSMVYARVRYLCYISHMPLRLAVMVTCQLPLHNPLTHSRMAARLGRVCTVEPMARFTTVAGSEDNAPVKELTARVTV